MEISRIFFSESILYIWEYKDSLSLGITSVATLPWILALKLLLKLSFILEWTLPPNTNGKSKHGLTLASAPSLFTKSNLTYNSHFGD